MHESPAGALPGTGGITCCICSCSSHIGSAFSRPICVAKIAKRSSSHAAVSPPQQKPQPQLASHFLPKHPSFPSWLFLGALAPRLAPSIRALILPSSGMVCPNRRTTRGNGPACATVLLLPRLAQQGTPCLSCSCHPRFHMRIGGSERAWGAAPRPSQSSPGRNMKASQASVVVLWPRTQPYTARNAVPSTATCIVPSTETYCYRSPRSTSSPLPRNMR